MKEVEKGAFLQLRLVVTASVVVRLRGQVCNRKERWSEPDLAPCWKVCW